MFWESRPMQYCSGSPTDLPPFSLPNETRVLG
jgi:hypothetical protein